MNPLVPVNEDQIVAKLSQLKRELPDASAKADSAPAFDLSLPDLARLAGMGELYGWNFG
jgi:hypothetical protein